MQQAELADVCSAFDSTGLLLIHTLRGTVTVWLTYPKVHILDRAARVYCIWPALGELVKQ